MKTFTEWKRWALGNGLFAVSFYGSAVAHLPYVGIITILYIWLVLFVSILGWIGVKIASRVSISKNPEEFNKRVLALQSFAKNRIYVWVDFVFDIVMIFSMMHYGWLWMCVLYTLHTVLIQDIHLTSGKIGLKKT